MKNNDGEKNAVEKVYFKRLIYFHDFRVAINIHEINRIEKIERYNEITGLMSYGIMINRGFEVQQRTQSQNLECFYDSEEERDERFEKLLVEFEAIGIDIIQV